LLEPVATFVISNVDSTTSKKSKEKEVIFYIFQRNVKKNSVRTKFLTTFAVLREVEVSLLALRLVPHNVEVDHHAHSYYAAGFQ